MQRVRLCAALIPSFVLFVACGDDVTEADTGTSTGSESGPTTDEPTSSPMTTADTSGSTGTTTADTSTTVDPDSSSSGESSSSGGESSSSGGGSSSSGGESSSTGGEMAVCGDDAIGGDEVCDGTDLAGADCLTEGFDAGEISCLKNCSALDTSACVMFSCGNGDIEGKEVCDGADLAGETCISQDFDGGTLACADNCGGYDTSGCVVFSCGNDLVEGVEVCDGSDISGETCITQGFDDGTLGCAVDCSAYDTSACVDYVCGNGISEPNEACDGDDLLGQTCQDLGFDDGTLACLDSCGDFDTSGCFDWVCGNDLTEPNEFCDGTDLGGATCVSEGFDEGALACAGDCGDYDTSACVTWVCGNGILEPNESCDQAQLGGQTCVGLGAVLGNLACTPGCGFNLGTCAFQVNETEPNDDGAVATNTNDFDLTLVNPEGPFTDDLYYAAAISPAGDEDYLEINNPGPGYAFMRLETFGPGGPGTCAVGVDTVVDVRSAANVLLATDDEAGIASCSLINNFALAPGQTVYVRVFDFGDNSTIASYFMHVQITPVVCGDGIAGAGETCDDGNLDSGDNCSSTCVYEPAIQEIEPNATGAEADANALAGVVADGSTVIAGSIPVVGDQDRFRVEIPAAGFYRFETFSSLNDCTGINTTLRLFDAAGVAVIADTNNLGIGNAACSAITFPLAAGTYYAQVEETGNNATILNYLLEVSTQVDFGAEVEPNEDIMTASTAIQTAGSNVYVFGDHTVATDNDVYAIDVPAGASLRLEIIEGDRAIETCEGNNIDSFLTLFSPAGVQLTTDDDDGRGFCSLLDGTGTSPQDPAAHTLPAGTYYARVTAFGAGTAAQFTYRLVATVRTP
jgi:cysteine-rich repeat protein